MHDALLPVQAATAPANHRDVRASVAAVIPPRPVPFGKQLFWWLVLRLAGYAAGRRVLTAVLQRR